MRKTRNRNFIVIGSGILTLLLLVIVWNICPVGFETNDDMGIMMFVTGAKTGSPTAETIFCNILWGAFLSSLYKLNESVPWYIGTYMLLIWMVLTIVCISCIRLFTGKPDLLWDRKNIKTSLLSCLAGISVFCTLYFSLFCYSSVLFQFTSMSAFCGMGAILLMQMYPNSVGGAKALDIFEHIGAFTFR